MKTRNMITILLLTAAAFTATGCGENGNKKTAEKTPAAVQDTIKVLTIDSLLSNAANLVGQKVVFEGACTHICTETGCKMFMMGTDNTKTLRVQAGEFKRFDSKCPRSIVRVNGFLREERIDEAYLQAWEQELKEKAASGEETTQGGCASEKIARGEKGRTETERIADFRAQIAQRKAAENKEYLSFYFVDAISYEIR